MTIPEEAEAILNDWYKKTEMMAKGCKSRKDLDIMNSSIKNIVKSLTEARTLELGIALDRRPPPTPIPGPGVIREPGYKDKGFWRTLLGID